MANFIFRRQGTQAVTKTERNRKKKALQDYFEAAPKSKESAKKALAATGIFTKSGEIAAKYGGQKAA